MTNTPDNQLPHVTVVVIGRNEGARLERCLRSIAALDYPADRIELIYVDGASTDDSCEAAERLAARVLKVDPDRTTAAAGRNLGWRSAQHDLVHFVDGDTIMYPAWMRNATIALADPDLFAVHGRCEEVDPAASVYNFWAHHDWYQPAGRADFTGGIALFRREALDAVNGFDEQLVAGEEPEMCYRIISTRGGSVLVLDEPMVRHDIAMTRFGQYWRRCRRTGYGYAEVAHRQPDMPLWRRAVVRNLLHAALPMVAMVCSLVLRSWWPVVIWAGLLLLAIVRNALRHHRRIGSFGGALSYSAHHYLSKLAMVQGQIHFWWTARAPSRPEPIVDRQTQT